MKDFTQNFIFEYKFALEYFYRGENRGSFAKFICVGSELCTWSHDLLHVIDTFNSNTIEAADTEHYEVKEDNSIDRPTDAQRPVLDAARIIYTRANDSLYSWTTLISWSRERGFSILPDMPLDIMREVLNTIIFERWKKHLI